MAWRLFDNPLDKTMTVRHYKSGSTPSMGGHSGGSSSPKGGGFNVNGGPNTPNPGGESSQRPSAEEKSGAATQGIKKSADKAIDAGVGAAKGNAAGEVANVANTLRKAKQTADTKGKGAAAADVAAAGVRAGVTVAADATVVGAPIAEGALKTWDGAKKALGVVGIKVEDRYVIYIMAAIIMIPIVIMIIVLMVVLYFWEYPLKALEFGFTAVKRGMGLGMTTLIDTGGASRLAYETPVKSGVATAANISNPNIQGQPKEGSYAWKLSQIDWEKAKYKTVPNGTKCNVVTQEVTRPDGTTRHVVERVELNTNPGKDLNGIARANCINNVYPIFNTLMRGPFITRNINNKTGIRYAYAAPKDSDDFTGKSQSEIDNLLRNKTLSRIWQRSNKGVTGYSDQLPSAATDNGTGPVISAAASTGDAVCNWLDFSCMINKVKFSYTPMPGVASDSIGCANTYDFSKDLSIDEAVKKAQHDVNCGIPPDKLKFFVQIPTEADIASTDDKKSGVAKALALQTMCNIYTRTQQGDSADAVKRYTDYVKNRIYSEEIAAFQSFTYAHTNRDHFLNIREIGGDSYKVSGMANSQEYNVNVNDNVVGYSIDADAASRIFGIPNFKKDGGKDVYNDAAVTNARTVLSNLLNNSSMCTNFTTPDAMAEATKVFYSPDTASPDDLIYKMAPVLFDIYYPQYKQAVATLDIYSRNRKTGQAISVNEAAQNVKLEDLLISLIRIESNSATAGNEDGVQNFNRMSIGVKAYNNALSNSLGGSFISENAATALENDDRSDIAYQDQSRSIAWRLFDQNNPRSFGSRFTVAFIDKPDRVLGNVLGVVGNLFNPLKNMVGSRTSLAYALTGKSNTAQAASSYQVNNLRIDPAAVPQAFFDQINPIDNAAAIESIGQNNASGAGLMINWELCTQENIPSRFNLLNPEPDKANLYNNYCREIMDITAPTSLSTTDIAAMRTIQSNPNSINFSQVGSTNRRVLSFMFRAYHFYAYQADALVYLSNPNTEDPQYSAAPAAENSSSPFNDPGSQTPINGASDTSALPCPTTAGVTDAGIGEKYNVGRILNHKLRLCTVQGITVNVSVANNLNNMINAAKSAGINLTGDAYRTYDQQVSLRVKHGCADLSLSSSACTPLTAKPGQSNHENGEAIDFKVTAGSAEFRWLSANAAQYGFKNLPAEAWHWSVDGK